MSIRLQLLLVALSTLILPWAGCQYARELEAALRGSQEQSLLASASTIANALSAQPSRVFRQPDDAAPFTANAGDLYVYALAHEPPLDGYRQDWGVPADLANLPSTTGYRARVQAAGTERYLYLYVEVEDPHFEAEPLEAHPEHDAFDRINLTLAAPDGDLEHMFFATAAPGLIAAQRTVQGEDGVDRAAPDSRILAFWLQGAHATHVEIRIPLKLVGSRLWLEAVDGDGKHRAGWSDGEPDLPGGRLFYRTNGLDALLATFVRRGTRVTVVDSNALKLGSAGDLTAGGSSVPASSSAPAHSGGAAPSNWYRYFMGIDTSGLPHNAEGQDRLVGDAILSALGGLPRAQWVAGTHAEALLTAAAPIMVNEHALGAVILEQAADQLLSLRDRALTRLFQLTLVATGSTVLIMFGFATWLSLRIDRLRRAADTAVGSDGSICLSMPDARSGDEIGALSRGFERLLIRLDEHTRYLRTLGGKLSHELRTPLTIVRSSLDNLESEGLHEVQRRYIDRARDGTQRLQSILSALGAAARVEESIKQAERVGFDLRALLCSAAAAYRDGFQGSHFALQVPEEPCFMRGAPELIVQLLDKLIENAVDYCRAGGIIDIELRRAPGAYVLTVSNDGEPISAELQGRLFESLFEHRDGPDDRPHFGLGLYIVRLIAEFHGGTATAGSKSNGSGAAFSVTMPML